MMRCLIRLVPRRGAGPDLRKEGRQIDEYLMRLLNGGSAMACPDAPGAQAKVSCHLCTWAHSPNVLSSLKIGWCTAFASAHGFHTHVCTCRRPCPFHEHVSNALHVHAQAAEAACVSVAFPAGWNNSRPWFVAPAQPGTEAAAAAGAASAGGGPLGSPGGGAAGMRPVMPPPPFPQQPWQGSRLGPLPPLAIYPGWSSKPSEVGSRISQPLAALLAYPSVCMPCNSVPCTQREG
jgi:hypothetical protein